MLSRRILVLVLIISIYSCRKADPSWETDVVVPLFKSNLTINDIIPDSLLNENPDNSFDIVYNTSLSSFATHDIFVLPDFHFDTAYKAPVQATVLGNTAITSTTIQNVSTISGGVELTHGTMLEGKMNLAVVSSLKGKIDFTFTVPSFTEPNGSTFQTIIHIPAGTATAPANYSGVYDLTNFKLDFTGTNGLSVNTIVINYAAVIDPTEDTVKIEVSDSIHIQYSFTDLVPAYARGFFGDTVSTAEDSAGFFLFKHLSSGSIDFEDIAVSLGVENSVGADVRFTVNDLASFNSHSGNSVSLVHPVINSPINITRSVESGNQIIPSSYSIALTTANSNIKQFVENLPDSLKFQMKYEINPLGNIAGGNDFGYYDKLFKTSLNMRIPLSLVANDLVMCDTVNIKFPESARNIRSGNLLLYFDNGFPFTAVPQLYLTDNNLQVTDSMISYPDIIPAPPLDANGVCIGTAKTTLTIPLDETRIEKMMAAKKMLIKVKFNTANQPNYIKIYSRYTLGVKAVADLGYVVENK